jgi:hypothetical protein
MSKIAPDGRLERGDSGRGLFSALEQGLQDGLENIGVLAESQGNYQDASVAKKEVLKSARDLPRNMTSKVSRLDRLGYKLENRIAANPNYPFKLVVVFTSVILVLVGCLYHWLAASPEVADLDVFGSNSWADGIYIALSLVIAAGVDDSIPDKMGLRFVFVFCIIFGLVIFAVVVGFITSAIDGFLVTIAEGHTKVAENQHTLILGWNEATLRAVVQICFLRRQYQLTNERRFLHLLWLFPWIKRFKWLMETPTTSCAVANMVIMSNQLTKAEMHEQLAQILAERGINPRRTKIGRDIVCRVGDPTNVNDLIRVGAHKGFGDPGDDVEDGPGGGGGERGDDSQRRDASCRPGVTSRFVHQLVHRREGQRSQPGFTNRASDVEPVGVRRRGVLHARQRQPRGDPGGPHEVLQRPDVQLRGSAGSERHLIGPVGFRGTRHSAAHREKLEKRPVQLEGRVHREDVRGDAAAVLHRDLHRDHPARDVGG